MKSLKRIKFNVSHTTFCIVFTASLYVICNALNLETTVKWFHLGAGIDYTGLAAYLTAGYCLFFGLFILLAHRRTIRPFAVIFIILSATSAYFISKYNVAIDRTMVMNTIHTDATEARSFLSVHMIPYLLFLVILPILVIVNVN